MERYSAEERTQARCPIASLISKSEKAVLKLTPETWQHVMLTDNLKALYMGAALLDQTGGGTDSFSQAEMEADLRAFASMIAKTEAAQPKFTPGTAQHTLLKNRLSALRLAADLIRLELEGA